jgi:tetratricopeptide (TPR) repeat protein
VSPRQPPKSAALPIVKTREVLAESHCGRALLTGDLKSLSAAKQSAKAAVTLNSQLAETHKAMSMVLFQLGQFSEPLDEAFTSLELADETDDFHFLGRITNSLRSIGEPGKAAAWCRLGLRKSNRLYQAYSLADCYADLGDDRRAAAAYMRASSLFPELPEGWMGLCRLALLQRIF